MKPTPVLLVEDYAPDVRLIQEMLRESADADEFDLTVASSIADAEQALGSQDFPLVLLDLGLPDSTGVSNVQQIRAASRRTAIVVMTGLDDERAALEALQSGAQEYVVKGSIDGDRLVRTLHHAIERNRLVNELDQLRERDYFQATHDALTGLPNRQLLNDRVQQVLSQAERHDEQFAYCYLDLDRFKAVNDNAGHAIGDELLKRIASVIRRAVRDSDTAARIGGDEFVLMLHPLQKPDEAERIVGRIVGAVDAIEAIDGQPIDVGISAGIARFPNEGRTAEALSQAADAAMYKAKRQRKHAERERRAALRAGDAPRSALQFIPWVRCRDWRYAGAELRNLGEAGSSSIEEGLRHGLAAMRGWLDDELPIERLGVEVSALDLMDSEFTRRVLQVVNAVGQQPDCLQFEVSESDCTPDPDLLVNLGLLRSHGIRIVVRDFGRDENSMARVSRFPVDGVKLDQRIVHASSQRQQRARETVDSIVRFARALELDIFADGVHSLDDLAEAIRLGAHFVQGPLFTGGVTPDGVPNVMRTDLSGLVDEVRARMGELQRAKA